MIQNSTGEYEFEAHSSKVRRSLSDHDYKARFGSLDVLNRCFHRSAIVDQDLKNGAFTVTANFTDYNTGVYNHGSVTVPVPIGASIKTLDFATVLKNFSDAIEALLDGRRCTVDDNGPGWPTDDLLELHMTPVCTLVVTFSTEPANG